MFAQLALENGFIFPVNTKQSPVHVLIIPVELHGGRCDTGLLARAADLQPHPEIGQDRQDGDDGDIGVSLHGVVPPEQRSAAAR